MLVFMTLAARALARCVYLLIDCLTSNIYFSTEAPSTRSSRSAMHAVQKLQQGTTVTASKAGRPATLEMDSLARQEREPERSKSGRPALEEMGSD